MAPLELGGESLDVSGGGSPPDNRCRILSIKVGDEEPMDEDGTEGRGRGVRSGMQLKQA